jgi:elongation factor G
MQLPIGAEETFSGLIDLLDRKAYKFEGEYGQNVVEIPIPEDMKAKVEKYRKILLEKVAENDEDLMNKYLAGEELDINQVRQVMRKATISNDFHPVLCGSALKNIGVQQMLDAVVSFLPNPLDIPPVTGKNPDTGAEEIRKASDEEPFAALAFKLATDPFVGKLVFFRVYSGCLKAGSYVLNTKTGNKERIGRIVRLHANAREDVDEVFSGEIAAAIGLKNTITGNTLCDEKHPIILEEIIFPEPVISVAIEPKTKIDQEKMGLAMQKLAEEDPTFKIHTDEETLQTIISGMGELHLDIIVDRMKREFKVEANVGAPQVAYKETIKAEAEGEGKYIKQSGGRGQYGHCWVKVEPRDRSEGFEFVDDIKGGIIPREFIPAIEKGVKEALTKGILAGYPVVDVKVTLYDGSYHEVDSSEVAFKIAGSMAFVEAAKKAKPVILEPIMKIQVTTPEQFMGDVIGDLNSKRAQITQMTEKAKMKVVDGLVPLSEMFGYATSLRSLTQGRANSSMEFSHYAETPNNIAQKIIEGKKK